MTTTQTPAAAECGGSAPAAAGHHVDTRDNVGDPDVLGWYGLEYDGPRCDGDDCRVPVEDDGDRCEECAELDQQCTECGADVARPGLCFDCDVQGSYVGGLAPRFGAQP